MSLTFLSLIASFFSFHEISDVRGMVHGLRRHLVVRNSLSLRTFLNFTILIRGEGSRNKLIIYLQHGT